MKRFLSTKYSDNAFSFAMLILRIAAGGLLFHHGYLKLISFGSLSGRFMNFMGLGSTLSLSLVIFAEVFCAAFIILGLFTRLAAIPPIIAMAVVVFKVNHGHVFGDGEVPTLFLAMYIVLLFTGPGKFSMDRVIGK